MRKNCTKDLSLREKKKNGSRDGGLIHKQNEMSETYPEHVEIFKMSARSFAGFSQNKILLRSKTHASQLCKSISKLHAKTMREKASHIYFKDLANMDQTPLPFVHDDNKAYLKKGTEELRIKSSHSGLEKRQGAIQLKVFASSKLKVPLVITFREQELRANAVEE